MIAALDGANSSATGIADGDTLILAPDPGFRGFTGSIEYKNYPTASPLFSLTLRGAVDANKQALVVFSGGATDRWLTIAPNLTLNLENLAFQGPADYVTNPLTLDGSQGGGIVRAYDPANPVLIGYLAGNTFNNIGIASSGFLYGGGVVGAHGDSGATAINSLTGNTFRELDVVSSGELQGGGVVGANARSAVATLGSLTDVDTFTHNTFTHITIHSGTHIVGGGVVGICSHYNTATLGHLTGVNTFTHLKITADGNLRGGGVVGSYSSTGSAILGNLDGNVFQDIAVTSGSYLQGGGVVGVRSNLNETRMGDLSNNDFMGITVNVGSDLYGGGVVGIRSRNGTTAIGTLDGNTFQGIGITVGGIIRGGGVAGIYGEGSAYGITVGDLKDNTFDTITVTAGDFIHGGLVGIAANPALLSAHLASVSNNTFTHNNVTSENGYIYGGLIYARSMGEIINSEFSGNTFRAENSGGGAHRVYGAVTLSTAHGSTATPVDLTIKAENGKQTVFADNITYDSRSPDGRQAESLYLGTLNTMTDFASTADAALSIDAQAGSLVELRDPIRVEQNTGRNFTLNVLGNGGDFRWGGINSIGVANLNGGSGSITLQPDSRTTLLASDYDRLGNPVSFRLTDPNGTLNFTLQGGANLFLDLGDPANPGINALASSLSAQTITLASGARIDLAPGSFLMNASRLAPGAVFLSLEALNLTVGDITLGSGMLAAGVNDYAYTLDYDMSSSRITLKNLDAPVYNCERGACDTNTALNALPADSPFPEMARDHSRDFFQNQGKETPGRLWVDTAFSRTRLRDGSRLGLSYRIETPALLVGADLFATEQALVGLAVGSAHPKYRGEHTRLDAEENILMAYGALALSNNVQLSGEIAASRVSYRHERTVKDEAHKADYRGRNVLASLELARLVELENGWALRPFMGQDYHRQKVDGYTEEGAGEFALVAKGRQRELWATRLGIGIDWQGKEHTPGWRFSGGGEIYGQTLAGNLSADTQAGFRKDNSQSLYPSLSERLPRHSLGLGLKAGWTLHDRMNIRLNYDLRASKRETAHEGSIRMEWNW